MELQVTATRKKEVKDTPEGFNLRQVTKTNIATTRLIAGTLKTKAVIGGVREVKRGHRNFGGGCAKSHIHVCVKPCP